MFAPKINKESQITPGSNTDKQTESIPVVAMDRNTSDHDTPIKTSNRFDSSFELTSEEVEIVNQLKIRDQQVRAHEKAHLAAAGSFAQGGPNFTYQTGPDGRRYAVGGEVSVDTSPITGNAQATINKAQQIKRAALAPAQPSATDRQVANQAASMEQRARAELADHSVQANGKEESGANAVEGGCEICGGKHSSDAHLEGVRHRLETTFLSIENFGTDASRFANTLDSYA